MAYELHIERLDAEGEPVPIPVGDWKRAVLSLAGVRLCTQSAVTLSDPSSGLVLSIPHRDGDAEVYFPQAGAWRPVFSWFGGRASFRASIASKGPPSSIWTVAATLAKNLEASIRGDDGQLYDLQTGEVIR